MVSDLLGYRRVPHPLRFESIKGANLCSVNLEPRQGTEKLANGKQHSIEFVPTGMKGLPQNVLLNFRLEFPKSELTIYLPTGISEIFFQMVSTPHVLLNSEVPMYRDTFQLERNFRVQNVDSLKKHHKLTAY